MRFPAEKGSGVYIMRERSLIVLISSKKMRWGQLGGRLYNILWCARAQLVLFYLSLFLLYLFTTQSGANFIFVSAVNYFHVNKRHSHTQTLTRLEFSFAHLAHTHAFDNIFLYYEGDAKSYNWLEQLIRLSWLESTKEISILRCEDALGIRHAPYCDSNTFLCHGVCTISIFVYNMENAKFPIYFKIFEIKLIILMVLEIIQRFKMFSGWNLVSIWIQELFIFIIIVFEKSTSQK